MGRKQLKDCIAKPNHGFGGMRGNHGFFILKRGTHNVQELNQSEFDSIWQKNAS